MATWSCIGPWKFISISSVDGSQTRSLFPFHWMRRETVPCWDLCSSTGKLAPATASPSTSKHTSKDQQWDWVEHPCWGVSGSWRRRQSSHEKVANHRQENAHVSNGAVVYMQGAGSRVQQGWWRCYKEMRGAAVQCGSRSAYLGLLFKGAVGGCWCQQRGRGSHPLPAPG